MKDESKTKKQLISELAELRRRAAELEASEAEQKQAASALRDSEGKYRSIVETAMEGIFIVDDQARIIFANQRWSEIFGYRREEAVQMTHFDLVFPEDLPQMKKRWESRQRGSKGSYEFRVRRKDGSAVWVLVGVSPLFSPGGEFLGTLDMVADITGTKKAEEALQQQARLLRLSYDAILV